MRAAQLRLKRVRDNGDQEMRDDKTEVIDIDVETCEVPDAPPSDARQAMTDAQARMPQSGPAAGEAAVTGGSSGSGGGKCEHGYWYVG